jgi:hypothetical protein
MDLDISLHMVGTTLNMQVARCCWIEAEMKSGSRICSSFINRIVPPKARTPSVSRQAASKESGVIWITLSAGFNWKDFIT